MAGLPDRIWVVGVPGSGKSTLAGILAALQGVVPIHMDELHWLPGWRERAPEATDALLAERLAGDRWVAEGNYRQYRRRHMHRVGLVVWLDLPLRITFPRLVRRGVRRSVRGETCCNGNRESLRRTFFHPESLLWYALRTHRRRRLELEEELATRPHVRLRSSRDVDRWLAAVGGRGGGGRASLGGGSPGVRGEPGA